VRRLGIRTVNSSVGQTQVPARSIFGAAFRRRTTSRTGPTFDPLARFGTAGPTFHRFASPRPFCCLQRPRCLSRTRRAFQARHRRTNGAPEDWTNSGAKAGFGSGQTAGQCDGQTAGFNVGQTARRGAGQTAGRRGRTNSNPQARPTPQHDGTNSEAVRRDKQHHERPNINGGVRQTPTSTARQTPTSTAGQTSLVVLEERWWWVCASPRFSRGKGTTHTLHLRCVLPWPLRGPFALLRKALNVFGPPNTGERPETSPSKALTVGVDPAHRRCSRKHAAPPCVCPGTW